jgi:hypothetical protein
VEVRKDDGPIMAMVATPTAKIYREKNIKGRERIYDVALRRLPDGLRESDGYKFMAKAMASRAVPVDQL